MTAIFVTSSGTGIGKTYVSALLISQLRAKGVVFRALKPILSGVDDQNFAESDAGILLAAMGEQPVPANADFVSRWRFKAALSPDMAARREGMEIDFAGLISHCLDNAAAHNHLLIEGVGGVMVPLTATHTVLDWMLELKRIQLAPLLVVGSYLGAMSHALTALSVMRENALTPKLIVVNESGESSVPLAETAETIARFAKDVPVASLSRHASAETAPDLIGYLL